MGNNSFGAMASNSMGQRSMPGLGQQAGVPGQTSGLGLGQTGAAGPLNGALGGAGRLGGGGGANFGAMQGQQPSYNPSGEILAMINKGQSLGLGLPRLSSLRGLQPRPLPEGNGSFPVRSGIDAPPDLLQHACRDKTQAA